MVYSIKFKPFFSPTTTTISEPAGESSNTAGDVNEQERHRTERVYLTGVSTYFSK